MAKNVVSFRLDPVHLDLLKQRAGTAPSMGAYARELVIRALNDQVRLRQDIRQTLKAIIAAAQRSSLTSEQLDDFVNRILG